MEPFASLVELTARLDFTLDVEQTRDATDALEYLSELARHHGKPWLDAASAPRLVKNLVIAAAKRYLRNPDGYTQSRAGDETLAWTDRGHDAGTPYFTDREVKMLETIGGRSGIISVPTFAWRASAATPTGFVPIDGSTEKPFPLFESGTSW